MNQFDWTCVHINSDCVQWQSTDRCQLVMYPGGGEVKDRGVFLRNLFVCLLPNSSLTILPAVPDGELYVISFPPALLHGNNSIPSNQSAVCLPDVPETFFLYYLSSYRLMSDSTQHCPRLLAEQTVSTLLLWFFQQTVAQPQEHVPHARIMVEQVRQIILSEYHSDLSLHSVADRLFVNPSYLSTVFHQQTGSTFRSYLKSVRLQNARRQVLETHQQVTDIAIQNGFNSAAYLIRSFREEYGVTPNAMRAQQSALKERNSKLL